MASLRFLTVLMLVCYARISGAQSLHIEGIIFSKEQSGISDATVALFKKADTSLVKITLSDSLGRFSFIAPDNMPYLLRISHIQYRDTTVSVDPVKQGTAIMKIWVTKNAATGLQEIVVSSRKALIERKIDRLVFNVENSVSAIGADVLEVLRKTPGVRVTNSDISLVGKSTVNVMINERLQHLSGEDLLNLLKSMSAADISKIEVITTPPAKYDAEGNAGLINIVTKKNTGNYTNGSIRASYEQHTYNIFSAGGSLNYRKKNVNIFGTVSMAKGATGPDESLRSEFSDAVWDRATDRKDYRKFLQTSAGIDYNINKRMIVGVLYTGGISRPDIREYIHVNILDAGAHVLDSMLETTAMSVNKRNNQSINTNYLWAIDSTGKKLNLDLNYYTYNSTRNRQFSTAGFTNEAQLKYENDQRTIADQDIKIFSATLNIDLPVAGINFSAGGKINSIRNNSSSGLENYYDGSYHLDTSRYNHFIYNESTQALYVNANYSWRKWTTQIGLRGEYTQTKGQSVVLRMVNENNYFRLFPTVYLQHKINSDNELGINYSKRINRPGYLVMDPFRWYSTPYSYSEGNPFLKPSFADNIEVHYLLDGRFNFSAYCNLVNGQFGQASFLDSASNMQFYKRDNLGKLNTYGISSSFNLNIARWWETNLQLNAFLARFSSSYYGGGALSYEQPSFYIVTNNNFLLNKQRTLLADLNFEYQYSSQDNFYTIRPLHVLSCGFKSLLLKKKLVLGLSCSDILASARVRADNKFNYINTDNYYDERGFRITCQYKFGNSNIKKSRERKSGVEDEVNRL